MYLYFRITNPNYNNRPSVIIYGIYVKVLVDFHSWMFLCDLNSMRGVSHDYHTSRVIACLTNCSHWFQQRLRNGLRRVRLDAHLRFVCERRRRASGRPQLGSSNNIDPWRPQHRQHQHYRWTREYNSSMLDVNMNIFGINKMCSWNYALCWIYQRVCLC